MTKTVLVTGAGGQLARCLALAGPPGGWRGIFLARAELDITDWGRLRSALDAARPNCVINTAAYTAVDRAESEPAAARRVNADGAANLVRWCGANGARLLHISTDFVFDGRAAKPYPPDAPTAPLGEYGAGKLAGERALEQLPPGLGAVVRTSWLYSELGRNFVKTMLRLMAEREELAVVDDQTGCPTSAHSLAALLWKMLQVPPRAALYHWHDGGELSWHRFALEVQRLGLEAGILSRRIPIRPIRSADHPAAAARPAYSVLDRSPSMTEYAMPKHDWRLELSRVLEAIARYGGVAR